MIDDWRAQNPNPRLQMLPCVTTPSPTPTDSCLFKVSLHTLTPQHSGVALGLLTERAGLYLHTELQGALARSCAAI